jgi:hypothetical protein
MPRFWNDRNQRRSLSTIVATMRLFQHVFKAKFELLGIKAEMNRLNRENL